MDKMFFRAQNFLTEEHKCFLFGNIFQVCNYFEKKMLPRSIIVCYRVQLQQREQISTCLKYFNSFLPTFLDGHLENQQIF
eukprot:UN11743